MLWFYEVDCPSGNFRLSFIDGNIRHIYLTQDQHTESYFVCASTHGNCLPGGISPYQSVLWLVEQPQIPISKVFCFDPDRDYTKDLCTQKEQIKRWTMILLFIFDNSILATHVIKLPGCSLIPRSCFFVYQLGHMIQLLWRK